MPQKGQPGKLRPGLKRPPRTSLSDGKNLDREKVKEMYLDGPDYDFRVFLEKKQWSLNYLKSGDFPIRLWKEEWLRLRLERQQDEIIPEAIDVRRALGRARLGYVKNWAVVAGNARQLLQYIMSRHAVAMKHDIDHDQEIQEGKLKPKFKLNEYGAMNLASAMKFVQEVELKALIVPSTDVQKVMIPLPEMSADDRSADADGEELKNMPVNLIGMKVPADKITSELAKWFDQFQEPVKETEEDESSEGV